VTSIDSDSLPTSADQVRSTVARLLRAVEEHDADGYLDATYHPDVAIHEAPALPYGGIYRGHDGVARHAAAFLETWSPHQMRADRSLQAQIDAATDYAYVRWSLGLAGRRFDVVSHYRFRDGLICESRMFPFDVVGLLGWWMTLRDNNGPPFGRDLRGARQDRSDTTVEHATMRGAT
jgi:uncharacterized protein